MIGADEQVRPHDDQPGHGRRWVLPLVALLVTAAAAGAVLVSRRTSADSVASARPATPSVTLADRGPLPALDTSLGWQGGRSPALEGKVVLYEFWTIGCVNCQRTLPYLRAWYDRYAADGLEIVGIHHPEFAHEAERDAIARASRELGVTWPVLYDDDARNWRAFANRYWPHLYLADDAGHLRYDRIGEGAYDETEDAIRTLLGVASDAPRADVPA